MSDPIVTVEKTPCAGAELYRAKGFGQTAPEAFANTEEAAIGALLIGKPAVLGLRYAIDPDGDKVFYRISNVPLKWTETRVNETIVYSVKAIFPGISFEDQYLSGSGSSPAEALGNMVKNNMSLFGLENVPSASVEPKASS